LSNKIINEVKDYINNVIRPPREEFGGMPTCPFAGPELDSGRLMIDVIVPDKVPLPDLIRKFLKSDKNSALFAQLTEQQLTAYETKTYQRFVNALLRKMGAKDYKCICFNPNDKDTEVDGFNPRAHAPYFLVNIASKDELNKAHKTLRKSKYYDGLNDTYLKFLKIKPKKS
jgi:hypothetical protein|tara:strand:- start:20 stop:532 length:513 start_codon:yes stop_codon:yes gene_type:complete